MNKAKHSGIISCEKRQCKNSYPRLSARKPDARICIVQPTSKWVVVGAAGYVTVFQCMICSFLHHTIHLGNNLIILDGRHNSIWVRGKWHRTCCWLHRNRILGRWNWKSVVCWQITSRVYWFISRWHRIRLHWRSRWQRRQWRIRQRRCQWWSKYG